MANPWLFIIQKINKWSYRQLKSASGYQNDNKQRIKDRKKVVNGFYVTEHALLRYFERVKGYDLDDVRRELTPIGLLPQTGKQVIDDLIIVTEGNFVITVYPRTDYVIKNPIRGLEKWVARHG